MAFPGMTQGAEVKTSPPVSFLLRACSRSVFPVTFTVRLLLALALVLAACDPSGRPDSLPQNGAPSTIAADGPDNLVLRIPRTGGRARVYAWPNLDSLIWTSGVNTPAVTSVLAFDAEAGTMIIVDGRGAPRSLDMRMNVLSRASGPRLTGLATADAWNVYGIAEDGSVSRVTPSALLTSTPSQPWRLKPPAPARELFPQRNGSLIVIADRGDAAHAWIVYPPGTTIADTLVMPRPRLALRTQAGDRIYFTTDSGLVGFRVRDMERVSPVRIRGGVRFLAATPSGDRLYAVGDSSREIAVIDRYRDEVVSRIEMPAVVGDMRMDPLGRYLVARAASGDSAWVIAVGTERLIGSVATEWREDIPYIARDGAIALVNGTAVSFVDGATLRNIRTVERGAADYWHEFAWDGFRPRAEGLDTPADFPVDSVPQDTSRIWLPSDSVAGPPPLTFPPVDTTPRIPPARTTSLGWTVSFAALLDGARAQQMAASIVVDGQPARVMPAVLDGTTVHRVVLGPYATRADAERAGRSSGQPFWVYEGTP
jgi:hypothetical protein